MMIYSKFGYESPEWVQADARLDRWCKSKKRPKRKQDAYNLNNNKTVVTKNGQ